MNISVWTPVRRHCLPVHDRRGRERDIDIWHCYGNHKFLAQNKSPTLFHQVILGVIPSELLSNLSMWQEVFVGSKQKFSYAFKWLINDANIDSLQPPTRTHTLFVALSLYLCVSVSQSLSTLAGIISKISSGQLLQDVPKQRSRWQDNTWPTIFRLTFSIHLCRLQRCPE